ncbi:hypothetical protein EMPS_07032 [Entomortierella parvispora]|uniref:F-box domain-containing protein n=1 Tax=Entomortierella parvispora TaxID=205924 RepID=A0A9P3HDF9_9FUNG|nr:hypothetical protein EMPS_07032 [Entomortierella parvispora]
MLLDSIVQHLSHEDIWNCAQVCSLWHEIFEPHQWRHLSLVRRDGSSLFKKHSEIEQTQILQHAGMVRELTVSLGYLGQDQLNFPKLETLIFTLKKEEWKTSVGGAFGFVDDDDDDDNTDEDNSMDGSDIDDSTAYEAGDENVDTATLENGSIELLWSDDDDTGNGGEGINSNHTLEGAGGVANNGVISTARNKSRWLDGPWSLLDKTPGLLSLHLPLVKYTPDLQSRLFNYFGNISSSIRTDEVRHLAHLTLEFFNNAGVDEISILRHLPESLLSVEFRILSPHYSFSNLSRTVRYNNHFAEVARSTHGKKELYPLRPLSLTRFHLFVDKLHDFGGREILLWFLRQCSQLKDLSLPTLPTKIDCERLFQTLVRHCPKLERLYLNMRMDKCILHGPPLVYLGPDKATTFESRVFSLLAPLAIKRLSIDIGDDDQNVTLQTLEQWSRDSLEELHLVRTGPMQESEFAKIRSTYPKLHRITYWKLSRDSTEQVNED